MKTFLLASLLVAQTASGADGGVETSEPATVWRLTKPTLVPPGRYMDEHSYQVIDAELKRLQAMEAQKPQPVAVEGYLIGVTVVGVAALLGGIALGYVAAKELR